jgi:hypothetical protein
VPRFWYPPDGAYPVDADGYLADPQTSFGGARVRATGELSAYRCLVLLGEPGAGKTRTISAHAPLLPPHAGLMPVVRRDLGLYSSEERAIADLLENVEVMSWCDSGGDLCLVLDAFDEAQMRIPALARLFCHYISQWPTDRLYLRITCRTAEWPQTLAGQLEKAFDEVGTFELLPLRRTDVAAFVPPQVNAEAFLDSVRQAHAVPLAARPLTLMLLARLFTDEGGFPERAADLYARGLLSLCDEQNPQRRDASAVGSLSPAERLAAGRRIAAVSMFGGRPVIWTGPAGSGGGDGCVSADDCGGGVEPWYGLKAELTPMAVREALQTGLFTGRGAQRLGWAHATFADYLAADWVVSNELAQDQVRALFFAADGRIYPQLRPAAAWAVAIAPSRHGWMTAEDPESFLGQVGVPDDTLRATVLEGLFRAAAGDRLRENFSTSYRDLAHAGLAGQLRPRLSEGHTAVRGLAIRVAEQCGIRDLAPDLVGMALDPAVPIGSRVAAAWAVNAVTPGTRALLPLISDAAVLGDDPDDELLGTALRVSWPHALSTGEALAAARLPKKRNLLGYYRVFLDALARALAEDDLATASTWLEAAGEDGDDELLAGLSASVLRLMAGHLGEEHVFRGFREVALRRARKRRPLFSKATRQRPVHFSDGDRHRLALSLIDEEGDLVFALVDNVHGLGLIGPADLPWLVGQYAASPPGQHPALARLFLLTYRVNDPVHVNAVLELPDDHPLFADVVGEWRRPVQLGSEQARRMRDEWELVNRQQLPDEQAVDDSEVDQWISSQVDTALAGDPAGFWRAAQLVTVRPGTNYYDPELQPDLTACPRWERLDPGLRDRILQAAKLYLQSGHCEPGKWLGQEVSYFPAEAGYRALILIVRLDPAVLATLEPPVWREWAPIIIGWTITTDSARWDDKLILLQHARVHADAELRDALVRIIRARTGRGEHLLMWWQECRAMWCQQLAEDLLTIAAEKPILPVPRDDLLEIIAGNDPEHARPLLRSWLRPEAITQDRDRARRAAELLLVNDGAGAWPVVYQLLLDDPELGKGVFLAAASGRGSPLRGLVPHQLADLYAWLCQHFPPSEDPQLSSARFIGPRDEVRHWRDAIPDVLARTGTAEAVEAMRRIADAFPSDPWLRMHLASAEETFRSALWTPVPPGQLRRLAADHQARLVRSAEELLRATVAALHAIQRRLQGDTPEAQLLWDTRVRRPKTEEEASDYLRQMLNDQIGHRGAIVNREVQVRRVRPTGIPERADLRVDAPAADLRTGEAPVLTIVGEVKAAWNPELSTAMRSQLADRYMLDTGTRHGLYIVLWFDVGWWAADHGAKDRNRVARLDRAVVLRDLRQQASALADDGFNIEVVMLDMSYERPVPADP